MNRRHEQSPGGWMEYVTGTKIRTDSVMCPRSSSRGYNTSASVTVTVNELGYEVRLEVALETVYRGTIFNGSRN